MMLRDPYLVLQEFKIFISGSQKVATLRNLEFLVLTSRMAEILLPIIGRSPSITILLPNKLDAIPFASPFSSQTILAMGQGVVTSYLSTYLNH